MKKSELFSLLFLVIATLFSSRVFFQPVFFPTHDLEYHIIRLWQFDKNAREGIFIPRWAPDLNDGYGVPVFSFFYPLPNYIAEAFLSLNFSYIESVYLAVAVGFIISPFTFYWWARHFYGVRASIIGALFYLLAPYHLVDVYIRGSIGEVWVLALAPLMLGASTSIIRRRRTVSALVILGLSSAFLLLSHTILGVTFFALGIAYSFIYTWDYKEHSLGTAGKQCVGYMIGACISAYFYIPVIFESSFVRGLEIMSADSHFPKLYQLLIPSWGSGFSVPGPDDSMSFQIGLAHIVVLVAAFILALRKKNTHIIMWVGSIGIIIFLMLEQSAWFWNLIPFMNYFQFPWRLLALVIFGTSFLAGYVFEQKLHPVVSLSICILLLLYVQYTYPVTYQKRTDDFYLSNPHWTNGTATLANTFNTKWFTLPSDDTTTVGSTQTIRLEFKTPVKHHYTLSSDEPFAFTPTIAYYPGWVGEIDQHRGIVNNEAGRISLSVPSGTHAVVLKLNQTPVQKTGMMVSLAGIVALAGIPLFSYARRY